MHAELAALFDECRAPTHASKRAIHDQLAPIQECAATLQKQIAEYRAKLLKAELAEHDHEAIDGSLERINQKLDAIDTDLKLLITTGRRLAISVTGLCRVSEEIETELRGREARLLATTERPSPTRTDAAPAL